MLLYGLIFTFFLGTAMCASSVFDLMGKPAQSVKIAAALKALIGFFLGYWTLVVLIDQFFFPL